MNVSEKGVLKNSSIFYNTPSNTAKCTFFYLKSIGHFICDNNYMVKRENYHSYLIMLVKKGSGSVCFRGKTYTAKANDVILLNCYEPHSYYTDSDWETLWLHFDGNFSSQFFELSYNHFGIVLSIGNSLIIPKYLLVILDSFKSSQSLPEALISCYIHRMLSDMIILSSNYTNQKIDKINPIMDVINYIEINYNQKLTLTELAASVSMSLFHFSRIFKNDTGYSPYEYIIKTRIDIAKTLLKNTDLSIKEISFKVGFNSESNFINTFHKSVTLTPHQFRITPL